MGSKFFYKLPVALFSDCYRDLKAVDLLVYSVIYAKWCVIRDFKNINFFDRAEGKYFVKMSYPEIIERLNNKVTSVTTVRISVNRLKDKGLIKAKKVGGSSKNYYFVDDLLEDNFKKEKLVEIPNNSEDEDNILFYEWLK